MTMIEGRPITKVEINTEKDINCTMSVLYSPAIGCSKLAPETHSKKWVVMFDSTSVMKYIHRIKVAALLVNLVDNTYLQKPLLATGKRRRGLASRQNST